MTSFVIQIENQSYVNRCWFQTYMLKDGN